MKTKVASVGRAPAGLILGHLMCADGIDCVIGERQSADHIPSLIRAGVLATASTDLMQKLGPAARMNAEGRVARAALV